MTTPSRRERIEAMLSDEPDDLLLRYCLALEFEKEGRHEESLAGLRRLAAGSPAYVPAFFMGAQQLARLGRIDEARGLLRAGIEAARAQGDDHAAGEMSQFLAGLGSLGDEP